jgi:hypothetical protein
MIADPARPVSGDPFLAEDEREQVLRGWAGARTVVPLDRLATSSSRRTRRIGRTRWRWWTARRR